MSSSGCNKPGSSSSTFMTTGPKVTVKTLSRTLSTWARTKLSEDFRLQNERRIKELCSAASSGGIGLMQVLIEEGADPNGRWVQEPCNSKKGYITPLGAALGKGQVEAIRFLLQAGADVRKPTTNKSSPGGEITSTIHLAAEMGSAELVQLFVDYGASIYRIDGYGNTPLHLAREGAVKRLIQLGASVSAKNLKGNQPLLTAIWREDLRTVETLLQHGASVNFQITKKRKPTASNMKYESFTPLLMSVFGGPNNGITRVLLAAGADLHQVYPIKINNWPEVARVGKADCFWLLCNPRYQDYGYSFCAKNDPDLGRMLLEAGANPTKISSVNYRTALESLCGPIQGSEREGPWDEYTLSLLNVISEILPSWPSSAHSSGKTMLVGIWSDFASAMNKQNDVAVARWVGEVAPHVICVSWIILKACPAIHVVREEREELHQYFGSFVEYDQSIESEIRRLWAKIEDN